MTNAVVEELIEIAGVVGAIRLCRHFRGRWVLIPATMHETHPIALIIGIEAAEALSRQRGGERIELPTESSALLSARNREISQQYLGGASVSQLAQDFGYTRAGIVRILEHVGVERRKE
jgi:hypothetical protein